MELLLVFIIFSVIVLIITIIGYILTKKSFVAPSIVFVLSSFVMLLFFNETFFTWVIGYTIISIIVTFFMTFFKKSKH